MRLINFFFSEENWARNLTTVIVLCVNFLRATVTSCTASAVDLLAVEARGLLRVYYSLNACLCQGASEFLLCTELYCHKT